MRMQTRPSRSPTLTKPHRSLPGLLVLVTVLGLALLDLRHGILLQRLVPLPQLDIGTPSPWFLDLRLSALQGDEALCSSVLKSPIVEFSPVPDQPYKDGCGWKTAVRLTSAAGAHMPANTVTCEVAAAFSMWMVHSVQIAAERHFKSRVSTVQTLGTYACRNIVGNSLWQSFRSQHATANAIDVSGFTLADGTAITVKRDWRSNSVKSSFLHEVHDQACRYFRVVLSPDYNSAHNDHFHIDRGFLRSCK